MSMIGTAQTTDEFLARAKVSIDKKDRERALADLNQVIKLAPQNAEALALRCQTYLDLNNYEQALSDGDRAVELSPNYGLAYHLRGLVYAQRVKPDFAAALADYTKVIAIDSKLAGAAYRMRAAVHNDFDKDYPAAIADANEAIKLGSNDGFTYSNRGWANTQLKNWSDAARDYRQAVTLGYAHSGTYVALSFIEFNLNEYVQAIGDARNAVELDPTNQFAKDNILAIRAKLAQSFNAAASDALWNAAVGNDTPSALAALNHGANPNAKFSFYGTLRVTPLLRAAGNTNLELANALISAGANVNDRDANGNSALSFAVAYTKMPAAVRNPLVTLLLKNGADVNLPNEKGDTPLISACVWAYDDVIELLLKAGARVGDKNTNGNTALLTAAQGSGTPRGLQMLLAAGADVNAPDAHGYTPLIFAVRSSGFGLAQVYTLLKAGAVVDLPADKKTAGFEATVEFAKQVKKLPPGSVILKLLDAALEGNGQVLGKLLAENPAIDKTFLNYLLLISVRHDDTNILGLLISKGANPNFTMGEVSSLKIANVGHNDAAAGYLRKYSTSTTVVAEMSDSQKKRSAVANEASASSGNIRASSSPNNSTASAGQRTCSVCKGTGKTSEIVYGYTTGADKKYGTTIARREESPCSACGGKGYTK